MFSYLYDRSDLRCAPHPKRNSIVTSRNGALERAQPKRNNIVTLGNSAKTLTQIVSSRSIPARNRSFDAEGQQTRPLDPRKCPDEIAVSECSAGGHMGENAQALGTL